MRHLNRPPSPLPREMVISQDSKDGIVTIRVAQDDVPNGHVYDSGIGGNGEEEAGRSSTTIYSLRRHLSPKVPLWQLVPLLA